MADFKSKFAEALCKESKQLMDDMYNGRVKADHDEYCDEGCTIDHGYLSLATEFEPLFKSTNEN